MKTELVLLALVLIISQQATTLHAQGSLTPPGAPAPTMKTLAQLEPRTPIATAPFTISTSGSYYLTTNLTVSSGDGITIATNGVTLDLNGFTIASTAPSAGGTCILINYGLSDLTISNGHIRGGVTNNGSGVYSGSGFGFGLNAVGNPQNVHVSGVSVKGCLGNGLYLGTGSSTLVEACTVQTVGGYGIVASTIKASVARDCGGYAIYGDQVADSRGESTGDGIGLYATATAQNCYGNSGSSYGLFTTMAQNCYGYSGSGYGLYAATAQNCFGHSDSYYGLYATTAQNCYGQSSGSGNGIFAYTVNNCYGYSASGYGIYASTVAIGSYGFSSTGIGLRAYIANSCGDTSFSITFKYNMP